MVDGNVEETLDLRGVQIHAQHALGAGGDDEVGDQLRGDRHAPLVLAVLARVAVVGDDGGDALGAGAAKAINEDKQLHQIVVDRLAGGEDDIDIAAAHILVNLDHGFAVGKTGDGSEADGQVEVRADALGELARAAAREDLEVVAVVGAHRADPDGVRWRARRIESTSASWAGSLTESTSAAGTASTAATVRPSLRRISKTSVM